MGLALALGTRAPVLLLDEPLASLDPLARREFLHVLVDAVRADGATALLSSHVITDIEQACDRLIVLGGGRPLLDLSIAEAHRRPPRRRRRRGTARRPARRLVGTFPAPDGEPLDARRGRPGAGRAGDARGGRARPPRGRPGRAAARRRRRSRGGGVMQTLKSIRLVFRMQQFEIVAVGPDGGGAHRRGAGTSRTSSTPSATAVLARGRAAAELRGAGSPVLRHPGRPGQARSSRS